MATADSTDTPGRAERCETCRFWCRDIYGSPEGWDTCMGECRRRSPARVAADSPDYLRWVAINEDTGNYDQDGEAEGIVRVWPLTLAGDWCGDFQAGGPKRLRVTGPGPDPDLLAAPIKTLGLPERVRRSLGRPRSGRHILTVGELLACTADQLLDYREFGETSLALVRLVLARLGLSLAGEGGQIAEDEGSGGRP